MSGKAEDIKCTVWALAEEEADVFNSGQSNVSTGQRAGDGWKHRNLGERIRETEGEPRPRWEDLREVYQQTVGSGGVKTVDEGRVWGL